MRLLFCFSIIFLSLNAAASSVKGGYLHYRSLEASMGVPLSYEFTYYQFKHLDSDSITQTKTMYMSSHRCGTDTFTLKVVSAPKNTEAFSYFAINPQRCAIDSAMGRVGVRVFKDSITLPSKCPDYRFTLTDSSFRFGNTVNFDSSASPVKFKALLNNAVAPITLPFIKMAKSYKVACQNQSHTFFELAPVLDLGIDSMAIRFRKPLTADSVLSFKSADYLLSNPVKSLTGFKVDYKYGTINTTLRQKGSYILSLDIRLIRSDTSTPLFSEMGNTNFQLLLHATDSCTQNGLTMKKDNHTQAICGADSLLIKVSRNFRQGTVAKNGTDFALYSQKKGIIPITAAQVTSHNGRIKLELYNPIPQNYTLRLVPRIGFDRNGVLNDCGLEISTDTLKMVSSNCNLNREKESLSNISVYPNPVRNNLHLIANSRGQVRIFNVTGQEIFTAAVKRGKNDLQLEDLKKGVYILHFASEQYENAKTTKLVVN